MQVAPYFGEDDRDGVKVEPFEVAPGELEPPLTSSAAGKADPTDQVAPKLRITSHF